MPEGPPAWPPARSWWSGASGRVGRAAFSILGARCIASWEALRRNLGDPQSILCLGNGPSSELPEVADARCDRLFRVNWIWRDHARHASPDLVFTADLDPPPVSPTPAICFPTRRDATRVLVRYVARGIRLPAYSVFHELPADIAMRSWSHRPTNGALMVAAATLLRPRRLVIAGMDLYLHPDGKYPGPTAEPNDYDPIHDRALDLAFLSAALSEFEGEVEILSAQLQSALQARRGRATDSGPAS